MNEPEEQYRREAVPNTGLTILYEPTTEPSLDIVCIHGIPEHPDHPERIWTMKGNARPRDDDGVANGCAEPPHKIRKFKPFPSSRHDKSDIVSTVYWPRDLVPKTIPNARVLTYGYNTHIENTIDNIAWDFLVALESERRIQPQRPMLFVAHSLGGLVVKKMLWRSNECHMGQAHLRTVFKSTIGVMFFCTPHAGFRVNEQITNALLPSSERLRELSDEFGPMVQEQNWIIHSFQEQFGVQGLNGQKVVDDASSYLNVPVVEITEHIEQNHVEMCRFKGWDDIDYKKVAAALRRIAAIVSEKPTRNMRLSLSEEQKRVLLDSLRFDQIDARQMTIKNAHTKTCKWMLNQSEYIDWLDLSKLGEHHGFLWIKGKPGAGKSTLMKFIFADARRKMKDKIITSFFFNARGACLEKSTTGMYRSLLLQLLERSPGFRGVFDSLGLATWNGGYYEWGVEALKALFEQAVQSLGGSSLVCFIDALNECDEHQIRDMISFFEHLGEVTTSTGARFQVCFSSRHYPYITIRKGLSLVLEGQKGHSQDIVNYLDSELEIGHSKLAKRIRADLKEKAAGVFMWVVLMVQSLNRQHDRGHTHGLRESIREIPRDLQDLFRDTLTRDRHNKGELLLCIQWVLFAKQPLKPEQLYYAILSGIESEALSAWDHDEITADDIQRFILNSSKGLAETTKSETPTVQFIHESVRDFLFKENELKEIWSDLGGQFQGRSHERLKQCCLDYMSIDISTYVDINDSLPKASSQQAADLRQSVDKAFPFLEYAIRNVLHHADASEGSGVSQTDFLQTVHVADWVKLNNLFERNQIRRHTPTASLLYILAEYNMENLLRSHPSKLAYFEVEDERYGTPIFAALATNSSEAVRVFLQAQADTLPPTSPFHDLCERYDRDGHKRTDFGRYFVFSRRKSILSHLIEHDNEALTLAFLLSSIELDTKLRNSYSQTLLSAARYGHEAVVKLLLEKGADLESKDENGQTPLSIAIEKSNTAPHLEKGGYEAVVKLLLEKVANPEPKEPPPDTTDSGYASAKLSKLNSAEAAQEIDYTQITEDDQYSMDLGDTKTVYSDSTYDRPPNMSYISEIADDLFSKVFPGQLDEPTLKRIHGALPELLKAFALKVGHDAPSQMHRDVMVFVHKYRNDIVRHFKDRYDHNEESLSNTPTSHPDDMTWKDRVDLLDRYVEEIFSPRKTPLDSNPSLLKRNEEGLDDDIPFNLKTHSENSDNCEEEIETDSTIESRAYRDFMFRSPAYEWLLGSLRREALLAPACPNIMEDIRLKIIDSLPSSHRVSRKISAETYGMTFEVNWNPLAYASEQRYKEVSDDVIERAITLIGSAKNAQALTCAEYLRQTWPSTGEHIIRLVKDVVRSGPSPPPTCNIGDNTKVKAWIYESKLKVEVFGTGYSIAEIGEQLAWLGAALRSSPYESGVAYCTPSIKEIYFDNATHRPISGVESGPNTVCKIDFAVKRGEEHLDLSDGQCWHNLFRNPVVVEGYPIPRRPESDTGLQIPLDIMAVLAQARRATTFGRRLFIKGFCTMLIPTKCTGNMVIWHMLFNEDGSHISYTDPRVSKIPAAHLENVSLHYLKTAQNVIGWCSNVKKYTGAPDANYTIDWCGLEKPPEGFAFDKVSISSGRLITIDLMPVIGEKDKAAHMKSQDSYTSQLMWIAEQFVLLYDVKDRRAWLVDGTSALLHLVRAYMEHERTGYFNHLFLAKSEQIAEPTPRHTGKAAAIAVLTAIANKNLELYSESDNRYCHFKDKVEEIYTVLEQIICHEAKVEHGNESHSKARPRQRLEGFDFMDVATSQGAFHARTTTLQSKGKGWIDFIRKIKAATLFGRDYGELFKPADPNGFCPSWDKMPEKEDYLAVCVSDIKEILKRKGSKEVSPWRLVDGIYWHKPDEIFGACQCVSDKKGEHADRVQVLLPENFLRTNKGSALSSPEGLQYHHGAVIFGHSSRFPLQWEDYGDPEGIKPCLPSKEVDGVFLGGAIGLSLISSSMEGTEMPTASPSQHSSAATSGENSKKIKPRDMERRFRVRGVPLGFTKSDIKSILDNHIESQSKDQGTDVVIKTLATEAHGRSQVATVEFKSIPAKLSSGNPLTLDLPYSKATERRTPQKLTIDDHFTGFTVLHSPPANKHIVNFVALSGLGGHAYGSFKERGGNHMWLSDSLPNDIQGARIIIYGYDSGLVDKASFQNMEDLGNALRGTLQDLTQLRSKPIIFIAHSLGGLVVKEAIIQIAQSKNNDISRILRLIYGAVFFGVPNDGLDIESFIPIVKDGPNRQLIESLGRENSQILNIQRSRFLEEFDFQGSSRIFCFYETCMSATARKDDNGRWTMTGEKKVVVTQSSATRCRPWEDSNDHRSPINRAHSEIVKFSANDDEYNRVLGVLKIIVERAIGEERCKSKHQEPRNEELKRTGAGVPGLCRKHDLSNREGTSKRRRKKGKQLDK